MDRPDSLWRAYRIPRDSVLPGRPSHAIASAKALAQLDQIVHEVINIYCGSRGRVSSKSIIGVYGSFLSWYNALPRDLHVSGDADPALPHALSLQ